MANYYCLMSGLPELDLNNAEVCQIKELKEQCEDVLTDTDSKLLSYFFLRFDCLNLVTLLKGGEVAELKENGNYSSEQLSDLIESALEMGVDVDSFPSFMSKFIREYQDSKDVSGYFPEDHILRGYYEYAMKCSDKMISDWYKFNFDITNILTAIIARKNGWNVSDYILGDTELNEMIRTHNSKDFGLSAQYDFASELMKIAECEDPVEKEKNIDAFKWLWLDDRTFGDEFSIDALFAYFCKLEMLERWDKLDVEQGKETFRQIIENLRSSAQVPEEFVVNRMNNKK